MYVSVDETVTEYNAQKNELTLYVQSILRIVEAIFQS